MSDRQHGTLMIIGSGPGIGNHVAITFATQGFDHIVLLARNEQRLEQDKAAIISKAERPGICVDTMQVDISDATALKKALKTLETVGHAIECIFFNAARIAPGELLSEPIETIEEDFKVCRVVFSLLFWPKGSMLILFQRLQTSLFTL